MILGEIYKGNISKDEQAQAIDNTGAKEVIKATSDAMAHIKDNLVEQLKHRSTKYYRIPNAIPGGQDGIGIFDGQLYFLIRDSKSSEDPRTENELKRPILTLLLGQGNLHVVEHDSKQYYCATLQNWERVIGHKPLISEL